MKWLVYPPAIFFSIMLSVIIGLFSFVRAEPSSASFIAFQSNRTGSFNIYRMGATGTDVVALTDDEFEHWFPNWSPDGEWIIFESDRDEPSNFDQYLLSPNGEIIQRLTVSPDLDCCGSWSPDMRQIAFHSARDGDDREIYIMNADGSNQQRITYEPGWDCCASWSPDGQWMTFQSDRLRRNTIQRALSILRTGGKFSQRALYIMRVDGSDVRFLAWQSTEDPISRWSPDGQWILFTSDTQGWGDVYRIHPDGTDLQAITLDTAGDCCASWSPQGDMIAFASNRSGNREIYIMDADGSNIRRLTQDSDDDQYPTWSPPISDPLHRRVLVGVVIIVLGITLIIYRVSRIYLKRHQSKKIKDVIPSFSISR